MDFEPILRLAADYANSDDRKPEYVSFFHLSRPDQLELRFDADSVQGHIRAARARGALVQSDDEIYDNLTQIVTDAVQRALTEYKHGQLFMELIIENLRNGRDAFTTRTDDQI